ncbi:hypothetical protein PRNP1_000559 [Phytophthora ramorum]
MLSPVKDISIGIVLAVGVGLVWRNWKGGEMDRISRFYKWQEAQQKKEKAKSGHADDYVALESLQQAHNLTSLQPRNFSG